MAIQDPHNGGPCDCDWTKPAKPGQGATWLMHRVLPKPDQSRYGKATSDPLGRDGPGWTKGKNGLPVRVKAADDKGNR